MKLAVILPAYCAEAYLPECLDSVLNQTFRDFFVIAINDASTDKTGEILEAYAAKDSRLQVFHLPENRGRTVCLPICHGYAQRRRGRICGTNGRGRYLRLGSF